MIEEIASRTNSFDLTAVPPQELQEAVAKVEHREYGIGSAGDGTLILENRVRLAPEAKQKMIELMEEMGMTDPADEDHWFWERIRQLFSRIARRGTRGTGAKISEG